MCHFGGGLNLTSRLATIAFRENSGRLCCMMKPHLALVVMAILPLVAWCQSPKDSSASSQQTKGSAAKNPPAQEPYRALKKEDGIHFEILGAMYLTSPGQPKSYTIGGFALVDAKGKYIDLDVLSHTYTDEDHFIKTKLFGPISVINSQDDIFGATESQIKAIHAFLSAHAKSSPASAQQNADTWTDSTELMWTKKDNGADLTQAQAADYCRNLTLGGYRDWRLPTIDELKSIYVPPASGSSSGISSVKGPSNAKGGIVFTQLMIWSSSQGNSSTEGLVFFFGMGARFSSLATTPGPRAICVRR
jgi:hypothetical protein